MKKRWKQKLSILLIMLIVITSGIVPENIIKASITEKSDSPSEEYPYYCSFCQYYYTENKAHLCDISRDCPNCNKTGITDDFYECENCNGTGNIISNEIVSPDNYRITFHANSGILDGIDYIYTSDSLNETVTASKNGCSFLGWSVSKDAIAADTRFFLNKPQTLYAVFSNQSNTITFDFQGASSYGTEQIEITKGSTMPSILLPKKAYTISFNKNTEDYSTVIGSDSLENPFLFQGYYTEANGNGIQYYDADGFGSKEWDKEENTTLYAFWENNGVVLPTAARKGYTFQGWSSSPFAESGMAAGETYYTKENLTLYAIWSKDIYTITYDLVGGIMEKSNPDTYDVETESFVLNNPKKEGYQFIGWISTNGEEEQTRVFIPKGSTGNKSYRAGWSARTDIIYKAEIYKMKKDGTYADFADEIKTLHGTVDTKVKAEEIAKEYVYKGFTYQYANIGENIVEEMKILPDGSAVLKLFYKRNQYKFNLGAIHHVNIQGTTEAGNYYQGESIVLKAQPEKGYHWVKWQSSNPSLLADSTEKDSSIIMPIGSITMTPKVEPNTNISYKVIIHRETLQGDYSDSSKDIIVKKKGTVDTKINAAAIAASYQYEGFTYSYAKVNDSVNSLAKASNMNIDADGTSELHLYYSRNSYKLMIGTYDTNKVTTSNKDTTLYYGQKIKLKASALPGYKFSYWDSSNTKIQSDLNTRNATLTMEAFDITMTPIAEAITYTMEFDANDTNAHTPENNVRASIVPEKMEYDYNEEMIMPSCVRKGFEFLGWSFSKNGTIDYKENEKVSKLSSIDKDIIKLYARWEEITYSIEFFANDNSTAHNPDGNIKAEGITLGTTKLYYTDNIVLPKSGFKRTGFTFQGWSRKEGINAVEYKSGNLVHNLCETNNGIVKLYAVWSEKSYLISFKAGDSYCYGSEDDITARVINKDAMDLIRIYYTDGFTMPDCSYIRTGFTFQGWSRNKNASKKTYEDNSYQGELQPGDVISDLDNLEEHCYYPVWLENKYKILYHANDNNQKDTMVQGMIAPKTVYYTENFKLPKSGFSRTGFTFQGWSIEENSHKVSYTKGETVLKLAESGTVTLYAAWKEKSYQLFFEPNDSYCYGIEEGITAKVSNIDAMDSMEIGYTEKAVFPECTYLRKGFTFLGWSRNKDDTRKTYQEDIDIKEINPIKPGTRIELPSDVSDTKLVYYPIWLENKYCVLFDKNAENAIWEMNGKVKTVYYTESWSLTDKPSNLGYKLKGYSENKDAEKIQYKELSNMLKLAGENNNGEMKTIYALWKQNSNTSDTSTSLAIPKIIEQTKNSDLDKEIKPYTEISIEVSAIGDNITYQWYRQEESEGIISDRKIENAIDDIYTIPAKDMIEENDGMTYYCVITGSGGQIKSEPVKIYIYGTPTKPEILVDGIINENGWSNQNISISVTRSAIKGKEEQVRYAYSFDKETWALWARDKKILWTRNTTSEGNKIYVKAYNKDCRKLESLIAEYTIKKDEEAPIILGLKNLIEEKFSFAISAKDIYSGISRYALIKETEQLKETDWKEESAFQVSAGQYKAYVMDNAGNITMQGFTIYENGYSLPSGKSGSYVDGEQCYMIGEGIAAFDKDMISDKSKITSIFMEAGITEIPDGFFEGFINLKEITISDSVVKIGENAFCNIPEKVVIHASLGGAGEAAAKKHHYTRYEIEIDGQDNKIPLHYRDTIIVPIDEMEIEVEKKTLVGFGTEPEKKDFHKDEPIGGLSTEMNGYIKLYPIYTDAYIDEEGILHITGDNTKYLDDIISDKDDITEIVIESDVIVLPEQIPSDFKNLTDLTLPESLKDLPEDRLDGMPENSVIHRPWQDSPDDNQEEDKPNEGEHKPSGGDGEDIDEGENKPSEGDPEDKDEGNKGEDKKDEEISGGVNKGENTTGNNNGINNSNNNYVGNNVFTGNVTSPATEDNIKDTNDLLKQESVTSNTTDSNNSDTSSKYNTEDNEENSNDEIVSKDTIDNVIDDLTNNSKKKKTILVQTKLSSIAIKKGDSYKIKALKGMKKWSIRNKKIVRLKKKGNCLILTGKEIGETILTGKRKKHKYQYIIQVRKENKKQIELKVENKQKNQEQILTTSGSIVKNVIEKKAGEKITLKLLHAGKKVIWKLFGKETLKKQGNTATITMKNNKKCTVTAKYKGKLYKCYLSSIS